MSTQAETSQSPYHLTAEQQQLFNRAMWIVLGIGIGWLLFSDKEGYATNVFTEIVGVAGTFFVLDFWVRRRDGQQKIEELKARLLREVRSPENAIAKHAIHELREHGWLIIDDKEPLLKGAYLSRANLEEADLRLANLQGTNLIGSNMGGADLGSASLQGAQLQGAHLQQTLFLGSDLQGASLWLADLQDADLVKANLADTNMQQANLVWARLWDAKYSEHTVLPDGSKWRPDVDMSRFTEPNHPDFWQPE